VAFLDSVARPENFRPFLLKISFKMSGKKRTYFKVVFVNRLLNSQAYSRVVKSFSSEQEAVHFWAGFKWLIHFMYSDETSRIAKIEDLELLFEIFRLADKVMNSLQKGQCVVKFLAIMFLNFIFLISIPPKRRSIPKK
jgi:hypothetical protein